MSFVVTIPDQEIEFPCEENQTILDAALEHGITISYGCRNGVCASCKGTLLSGQTHYPEGQPDGISEVEIQQGEVLFCKAVPLTDLNVAVKVVVPDTEIVVKTLPSKVTAIEYLTDDVVKLVLQLPAMESFNFKAGQWVYFVLNDGRKRAFSLANAPNSKNELELQIRHAIGGVFTDFVFNNLKEGAMLRIEGPHGTFWYQHDDRPLLLVAGGTGFAPIKGIFEELSAQEIKHPIHLFWGSRARQDLYQEYLVKQWVDEFGIDYTPVLSDPLAEDDWDGETGFVHQSVLKAYPDLSGYAVYMAGPPQMIQSCKDSFIAAGLDENRLYYDSFDYSNDALNAMQGEKNG
jgi:CDP-4-dehydro-6-deoxyglucose reductase, E3